MRVPKIPPRLKWIIPSSVLLHSVRWFDTNVSGRPINPIITGQNSSWCQVISVLDFTYKAVETGNYQLRKKLKKYSWESALIFKYMS